MALPPKGWVPHSGNPRATQEAACARRGLGLSLEGGVLLKSLRWRSRPVGICVHPLPGGRSLVQAWATTVTPHACAVSKAVCSHVLCTAGVAWPARSVPEHISRAPPRGRKAASRGAVAWGPWRSLHMRWGWDLQTHVHLRMWPPHSQAAAPSPAATGVWVERLAGERAPLV